MSTVVRPAHRSDAESICQLLHYKMNPKIPLARWRRLMNYPWLDDKPDFGQIVVSDGDVLGYCGQIYADRMIVGGPNKSRRKERIVSMSSWYLDKSLRGKGLGKEMLLSCIKDPSLSYTTLTNSRKPLAIVESAGFDVLEDHRHIWRKSDLNVSAVDIADDLSTIRSEICEHQRTLVDDMSEFAVVPFLVKADGEQALLYFSIKRKGNDVVWFDVLYSSNHEFFVEHAQALANQLLPEESAVLAVDGRFVPEDKKAGLLREDLPVPRFFISNRLEPKEIDLLYSELQLLDLKLD